MSQTAEARVAGVRLSSPDRVLFAEQGVTKRELAGYFEAVAEWMLPHLRGRPLTLLRCPRGATRQCFVQRRANDQFPDAVRRVTVPVEGESAVYLVVEDLPGLIAMAQMGVLELHTWGARRDRLERPDRMILDLDPDASLSFGTVVEAARRVRSLLRAVGLEGWVKTSGGKGLHVVVPLVRRSSWDEVRGCARAIAERLEREEPDRFVAQASRAERGGRIYVDYLRNAWSASAVAAYSTRARPGAPVSTPLAWDELDGALRPNQWNVRTVPERLLGQARDPWEGFGDARQSLTREVRRRLGADPG